MFKMNENGSSITFSFSSEMHLVDRVIQSCRDYLKHSGVSEFSQFRLVLRELLINAVEHGNRNIVEHTVICSIEHMGEWQFRITVEDEGDGFDPRTLDMKMPKDPEEMRKRGYPLVNAFTDQLEFSEKGNRVIAYIRIPRMTVFRIRDDNGWQIITPSGDITASIAEKFRTTLVELIDKGHSRYRFDLAHVEDIDSVGLSVMIVFAKMLSNKSSNMQLEIINSGKALIELFHMTRMTKTYKVIGGRPESV
ncbi:ATP-binding protein [Desulfococcaceae bacterium HSG8]|nr:ATP-binding protein [Desulfococcaceae bacterium HSG8]